jgi:HEAT repeat protein
MHPARRIAFGILLAGFWLSAGAAAAQPARPDARSLADWQADLASPSPPTRQRAVAALAGFGAEALAPLGKALGDAHPEVRLEAAKSLGKLGPVAQPAIPDLARTMKDPVPFVRRGAAAALGSITPGTAASVGALMDGMVDPDPAVIDNAAHSLLHLGPVSLPALNAALKSPDVGLRQMAVLTLSGGIRFGRFQSVGTDTVTALAGSLDDTNADIREEAARALADVGPTAKDALPALKRTAAADPVEPVRSAAQRAIERIETR